jgi:hypothetical protein
MEMIEVVNPTIDDYLVRVHSISAKYLNDPGEWLQLTPSVISDSDDRDEFSFIKMALWDQLMEKEFFSPTSPPGQASLFSVCTSSEPGVIPGSTILMAVKCGAS